MSGDDQRWLALQRQALLGAVSALVAHEFSNIMTPVLVRSQEARKSEDLSEMRRALDCTVAQTDRAISIARRLLEAAHGAELTLKPCNVAESVQRAFTAIARPFPKDGIQVAIDVPADLQVRAEPVLFDQVLVNLLLDSRDSMAERRAGRLQISARRAGRRVQIELRDTGVQTEAFPRRGIYLANGNDHPRQWEHFELPIAACRLIAEMHQARFGCESDASERVHTLEWPAA